MLALDRTAFRYIMHTIYTRLTREFNYRRARAIICSGQAAVLHRIAIMSKDGDWIIREEQECTAHILQVLGRYHARYRFGAPLDIRWLKHGWSSHFEFAFEGLRVRTDFFTRPPRLSREDLNARWRRHFELIPVVNLRQLALMKQTNREKDYVVIGEIARRLADPSDQLLFSRSATDLMALAHDHPKLVKVLAVQRPLLKLITKGRDRLEAALDTERRSMIHDNERRLLVYQQAAQAWQVHWPSFLPQLEHLPLEQAHDLLVQRASGVLPYNPHSR